MSITLNDEDVDKLLTALGTLKSILECAKPQDGSKGTPGFAETLCDCVAKLEPIVYGPGDAGKIYKFWFEHRDDALATIYKMYNVQHSTVVSSQCVGEAISYVTRSVHDSVQLKSATLYEILVGHRAEDEVIAALRSLDLRGIDAPKLCSVFTEICRMGSLPVDRYAFAFLWVNYLLMIRSWGILFISDLNEVTCGALFNPKFALDNFVKF